MCTAAPSADNSKAAFSTCILTLFAIAKELEKSGNISPMVEADLAVGLPPEHYALRQRFADYFKRGRVNFVFNGAPICLLHLEKKACRASYQQRVRCVYGEPHKQTGP